MSLPDFSFGAIMRSKKDPREIGVAVGLQEMLQEIYHVGYYEDRFMLQLPDDDVSIPCALDDYEVIRPGVLPFLPRARMKEKDEKQKEYEAELAWVRNYISKPILFWVIE